MKFETLRDWVTLTFLFTGTIFEIAASVLNQ
jgi:hypothetical protein